MYTVHIILLGGKEIFRTAQIKSGVYMLYILFILRKKEEKKFEKENVEWIMRESDDADDTICIHKYF